MVKNILFVCTGNTCRSPMAEAVLENKSNELKAQSAGIFAADGLLMNDDARQALLDKGMVENHHSQSISEALLTWADLVLVMTHAHRSMLVTSYPTYQHKIHMLKQFVSDNKQTESALYTDDDIADPFGKDLDAYKDTLSELEKLITNLVEKIQTGDNDYEKKASI